MNTASRMESHGQPGRVMVSASTTERLGAGYELEERGTINVKGRGDMQVWFLVGRKSAPAVYTAQQ